MKNINHLQSKLKSQLLKSNLSIREVERRAGLNRSALSNILQGKSKNPTLHILYALAEVLGCTLSDFIETSEHEETTGLQSAKVQIAFPTLVPLLHQTMDIVSNHFKNIKYEPNLEQFWICVKKVYVHALENHNSEIDHLYAEWLIDKFKE
ncbi:MAG: helix-turn-helix transcriptional regulator [Alphaproteobacteria bacterium]|nr:helix-turn-helix transcriptional regulator [Alphaproteobacteria bacterium]